ncbi:dna repair transcription protein [Moniliophthora roreri MCA 2997]|uniref:MMS19 nucleotide excision repair protein n=1 Tax=Moniliophthora roreri (strain MCA 2997) TaxID=1381753 RepID=V2XF25_MONRO|nr:dna repair transcription protein [Moniliophthora roreri MCA 2997]
MESTERLVRTWMASERDEEIAKIVSDINSGSTTLLSVVKALGEYLTAEEDQLRTKGVELLSEVLSRCSAEKFNHQSVRVLTNFYCSKMEDWDTVIPALKGLSHLTTLPAFTPEEASQVLDSVFQHVKMKNIVQSVRYTVFTIFDNLMARHRDALKTMGPDFIGRYVVLVEGEKDPRNLLLAFAIARVIIIEFDISQFVESMFNITFCYFPITFRPPPNDPYGITTDDLRNTLRQCLCATPAFGPLAIPLFLEKLAAGSPATKHDTLVTMSICFPVYGASLARNNARKLWNALKLEVFQPMSISNGIDVESQALQTIRDLVKTIYADNQAINGDESIEGLARDACEECLHILHEPEKSQAKPAIKILCAFLSTTPSICRYTASQLVPHLLKLFINPDEVSSRPSILLLLSDVIAASRDALKQVPEDGSSDAEGVEAALSPFKDELLSVLASGLKVASCRDPAIACLLGLVSTKYLLTEEELGFIVHCVNEVLAEETDEDDEDTSSAALKLLAAISMQAPSHVRDQTLPQLFSALPDRAPSKDDVKNRVKYWKALSALTTLCRQPELFEILVIRLTTRLDLLCFPHSRSDATEADLEPDAAYGHSILLTIHKVLLAKIDEGHHDIPKFIDSLVPRLFNIFVYSAMTSDGRYMVGIDPRLIIAGGRIITSIIQSLPLARQESYVQDLFGAYYNGRVKEIASGQQAISDDLVFRPFDVVAVYILFYA